MDGSDDDVVEGTEREQEADDVGQRDAASNAVDGLEEVRQEAHECAPDDSTREQPSDRSMNDPLGGPRQRMRRS